MHTRTLLRHTLLAFFALIFSGAATLQASGSPDLVGILAAITEPGNAAELGLTQDQLDRLETLIKQHESQALTFSAQIRQLPSAEQRAKKAENIRLVERQGLAFLTDAQRSKAEMWRLQKLGPVALIDPEIAGLMGVSDEQIAKIRNVLEGKTILDRELGRTKAAVEINNRIIAVLDESQKIAWQTLVGKPAASEPGKDGAESVADGKQSAPAGTAVQAQTPMAGPADGLVINFNATPWSEVLKWLAKEAELSLQADSYPVGTFTYRDPFRRYSVAEAMDVMNGVLLGRGYTLVKKNRILISVDLGSGESAAVIKALVRELSELVLPEDLDKRGNYEIVSCVFSIERSTVEEIEREVNLLIGPSGSVVPLPTAGQIVVCETAGKLRIIRELIAGGTRTKKIEKLTLKHVSADEVLAIARPLLGLKDGVNTSEDLSMSMDTFGNTIFATGSADKLLKLRDITLEIDVKPTNEAVKTASVEQPKFKSHRLLGSDPTTTMDVLQSTFAGQLNMKLSLDPKTSNILALATEEDHKRIDDVIAELAGQSSDFEVIQLTRLDTQAAILTLEKFFGKQSKDATTAKGPIFYGDAAARRIMVKGTKQETEQIRTMLSTVEETSPEAESPLDGILLVPLKGKSADRMLDQIEMLMQATKSKTKFRMVLPAGEAKKTESNSVEEPARAIKNSKSDKSASKSKAAKNSFAKYVATQDDGGDSPAKPVAKAQDPQVAVLSDDIVIRRGPNGLIVTSDNPEALKEFNRLYKIAQAQMANAPAQPAVFVLQHIKALAAADLIKSIIAGEQASSSGGGGGLIGDVASSVLGGGLLGGLFGGGGGGSSASTSTTVSGASTTGTVVITPDPRLNALWVQGNSTDMQMVEDLIELIDIADSGVQNLTRGTPKTIPIRYIPVAEVEAVVKDVFSDRIAQPASAGGAQRQPSPEQFLALIGGGGRRGGGGGGNAQSELKEQTMTVSSDKKNNALIVVATPTLFADVESLVSQMDQASEDDAADVVVMQMPAEVNTTLMQNALKSAFGANVKTTAAAPNSTNPTAPAGGANPADFFQQFRNRGMGGGATPGGFGGFGGGAPGGGGGGLGGGTGGFGGGRGGFGGGQGGGAQGGGGFGGGGRGGQGGGGRGGR